MRQEGGRQKLFVREKDLESAAGIIRWQSIAANDPPDVRAVSSEEEKNDEGCGNDRK